MIIIKKKPYLRFTLFAIPIIITLAVATLIASNLIKISSAADASHFNPGRIIDDVVFYDSSAMNATQIQQFLNSKVPTCDTNGQQISEFGGPDVNGDGKVQRWEWGQATYNQTVFTCLKDYSQSTPTMEAASGLCEGISGGTRSAAQIIEAISQACHISPQVLLVLLNKEQSLVTDTWPLKQQYDGATGFDCPDTAPCDPNYAGFFYQVYYAARQFQIYKAYPNDFNYVAGRNNNIYWNPDLSRCGSGTVFIQNQATAALYIYTPYQPNQAALSNLYGTGDSCSSYGNRNFWRMFTDWFGNTTMVSSTAYIPNGVYKLKNPTSSRYIDAAGGGVTNGTPVWLYDANDTVAQNWQITRDNEGFYSIKNIASGRYVDITSGSTREGAKIQLWDGNDSCAQKWAAIYQNNNYIFLHKCSGLALDLVGGSTSNTTRLQTWRLNYSHAQSWSLVSADQQRVANGIYNISTSAGLVLDLTGGQSTNGTPVQIWDSNSTDAQKWALARQPDGLYTVKSISSGRHLDVRNASTKPEAAVQIFDKNLSCAQKWAVTLNDNSTVTLRSACSGLAIDVAGGAISTQGTGIQTYTSNGSAAQQWNLTSISPVTDGTYSLSTIGGKLLDLTNGQTSAGTLIQIWDGNGTTAQKWQLTRQSSGFYKIKNIASNRYLDVRGGSLSSSTKLQVWDDNSTCAQNWSVVNTGSSTLAINSACTGFALDVAGGAVSTRASSAQVYPSNDSGAQKWILSNP